MAFDAANNSPPSRSYFQKTVTLQDWWLTIPETSNDTKTLGVAGFTSQQNRAARSFSSAPILKIYDLFELETIDGVCVILQGYINKDRTLQNGFSAEVFDHFFIGFPPNWKEFSTNCHKRESAPKCVTNVQDEDGKDSIEGDADFYGKPDNCDSYIVDMGVEDCKDLTFSNKTSSTRLNASSIETPHEHIIKAGHEVLSERSPVTPGFEDDPSLEMSSTVRNAVDSSTGSKCLGVSSRRMTRSMKKMDNSKNNSLLLCDVSNLDKVTLIDPENLACSDILRKDKNETLSNNKDVNVVDCDVKSESRTTLSKGKQNDQNNDDVITPQVGILNHKDADVSGESEIDTRISDLEAKLFKFECSDPLSNASVGVIDVNDDILLMRTNMKSCRNKKKSRVDVPQREGVPATHGINSKEAIMTRNKSKSKLPVKRKLITSPKSAKTAPSRAKKGSEERFGSANILSLESFSGKKSRSGRVVLPPLEFWRNQIVVYDEDRQPYGVQEPI